MALADAPTRPLVTPSRAARTDLPPPAWWPTLLLTGLFALVVGLSSGRYGYFGDELYFLAAGDHLAWGYADQPPGVPLLAHTMQTLFPGSLPALRLPSLLATCACVVFGAVFAREFGGDGRAQTLSAAAVAVAPHFVGSGHLLVTWTFDQLLWTWVLWLLVRWTRLHRAGVSRDRLLVWAGVVTAVALQVKLLIPALWVVVLVAVAIVGPRALLTRPALWVGAVIAVSATAPTLLWQAAHGWPQLRMPQTVASETGGTWTFLEMVGRQAGLVGTVAALLGLWRLLRSPGLRPYRFLGWSALALTVVFLASGGRPYYVAGLYVPLFAAGIVGLQRRREARGSRRWWWCVAGVAYAFTAWKASALLPWEPVSAIQRADVISTGSIGWRGVTGDVARAYRQLPQRVRAQTSVITDDYWSASAIHHYGPARGIDEVFSTSRGFWYLARPPRDTEHVLYVGATRGFLQRHFGEVDKVTTIRTALPARTYYEGMPVWLASDPKHPWPRLWPRMHHMSMW